MQRIDQAVDYIFQHLDEDLSLQALGKAVHYSPFHLQKLFKQAVGQTPKQYALRLRVETAFHLLVVHPEKSVQDIALEAGFSSPAVFSRSMKSFFGRSPEKLRSLSHSEKMYLLHRGAPLPVVEPLTVPVSVERFQTVRGVYVAAPFDRPFQVQRAFRQLTRYAETQGIALSGLRGILAPHRQNTYMAFLPVSGITDPLPFPAFEIPGGLYATFPTERERIRATHFFLDHWLPSSGYKIGGITGFETFPEGSRRVHIPVEPEPQDLQSASAD